jgi:capsular polysaccharide export protein
MVAGHGTRRSVLFLQGLATPFFARLGAEIARRGHAVHKINFHGGDRLFWLRRGAVDFRGRFPEWSGFLSDFLREKSVTDIVLFGDCRPYHRVAIRLARLHGITVHIFEEGYFRPDWITLEQQGTNAFSSLPRTPQAVRAAAATERPAEAAIQPVSGGFARRIRWEVLNQLSLLTLAPYFRHYRRHRCSHPLHELWGWFRRLAVKGYFERRYTHRVSEFLTAEHRKFYLLPLQLANDYQIREHSHFRCMADVMRTVLGSFARSAPRDSFLIIKLHPLDNGLVNIRRQAGRIARRLGMRGRVLVIDGGHLPTLLARSQGVVVVNSTTGLSALHHNRPLKALGRAVFDMPGLTFQEDLDRFWREGSAPDQELFRAFRKVVLHRAQINGSFFTDAGISLAIEGSVERMGLTPVAGHAAPLRHGDMVQAEIAPA